MRHKTSECGYVKDIMKRLPSVVVESNEKMQICTSER